jgi:hypothetical protein
MIILPLAALSVRALVIFYGATAEAALIEVANACFAGLRATNLPFCIYGALACVMFVQAWLALKERKPQLAREHSLHGLAYAILAFLHLLG